MKQTVRKSKLISFILSFFVLFLIPAVLFSSVYSLGLINSFDYNKTLITELGGSINDAQRFLLSLDNDDRPIRNWSSYSYIYNHDFYDNRFSVSFRTSADSITIKNKQGSSISSFISDISQSNISNNETHNFSALSISFKMTDFKEDSIIVGDDVSSALNVVVGDTVVLVNGTSGNESEYLIGAVYSHLSPGDETYLNDFYLDGFPFLCFVSTTAFNGFSSESYSNYFTFGHDADKLQACIKEIDPFTSEGNLKFRVLDNCELNNKTINNYSFSDYSTYLYNKASNHPVLSPFITYFVALLLTFLASLLADHLLELAPHRLTFLHRHSIIASTLYGFWCLALLCIVSFLGRLYVNSSSDELILSPKTSLRLLSISGIIYTAFFILIFISRISLSNSVEQFSVTNEPSKNAIARRHIEIQTKESGETNLDRDSGTILIVGTFNMDAKSAGEFRCEYYSRLFNRVGFKTLIACVADKAPESVVVEKNGVRYVPYSKKPRNRLQKMVLYMDSSSKLKRLINNLSTNKPNKIFIYSVFPVASVLYLKKYCKANHIELIFDVVEWFRFNHLKLGFFFASFMQNRLINRVLIDKKCKVFAISSFLEKYYSSKGIPVLRVPYFTDVSSINDFSLRIKTNQSELRRITIMYAGNPARKKDLLEPIFRAFLSMDEKLRSNFLFVVAGVEPKELLLEEGVTKDELLGLAGCVVLVGTVSHETIEYLYSVSDYSILVRSTKQISSKAGFPTKISESLAHGVPPITNITSDLGLYLNNQNSIILPSEDYKTIQSSLTGLLDHSEEEIRARRVLARKTAKEKLDIDSYTAPIKEFLDSPQPPKGQ